MANCVIEFIKFQFIFSFQFFGLDFILKHFEQLTYERLRKALLRFQKKRWMIQINVMVLKIIQFLGLLRPGIWAICNHHANLKKKKVSKSLKNQTKKSIRLAENAIVCGDSVLDFQKSQPILFQLSGFLCSWCFAKVLQIHPMPMNFDNSCHSAYLVAKMNKAFKLPEKYILFFFVCSLKTLAFPD